MANVSKRRTKKNIPVGVAHIHSTFNNIYYPRGRFGGRQPLCGTGVTSLIAVISRPAT